MWVYPTMTGSLVRSVWKTIQSSDDPFILQRNDTALMAYEEAVNSEGGTNTTNPTATVTATTTSSGTNAKRRTTITTSTNSTHSNHSGTNGTSNHPVSATIHTSPRNPIYRIITRNFPHYRVAEAIEWNDILEDLEQLQQTVLPRVEGKLTSKKVVKWLRNWHSHGESILPPLLKHSINQHGIMDINQSATHLKQAHQLNEVDETGYASSSESSLDDEEEEENRYSSGTPVPTYAKHTKTPLLLVRSPTIPVNKQGEEEEEESLDAPMDRTHSTTSLGIPLDPHDPTRTDSDQCERLSSSVPLSKSTSKQHKRSWSAGSYEPASANTTTATTTTTTTSAIPMALNASQSPSLTPQHTMNHGKTRVYPKYPPLPPPTTSTSTATTKKSTTSATNHGMTLASHSSSNDPSQDTSLWDTLESYTRWVASADNGADAYLSPGRPSMDTDIMEDDFNASNLLSPSSAANGNATATQGSTGRKRAQSTPANLTSPLASVGIEQLWEFPLQFVALLSMPETDGRPSYQTLRDMAQVRQRRRVLFYFTLFILLVRYCSFDLFILVLFASNCGMLFLMKNSRRVNMTLAKRSVRQRVNWAKQWMGGLIKHRGNNNNSNANGNLVNNQPELATLPPTPVTATAPTHPSVTSSTVTSTATTTSTATSPCVGSKATAVRRKLRLRGRNSDAATTAASVGVVVTRLEEEAANMTNGSISDSSPPNKRSTARNSFASAIVEDTASTSSLPDTSNTTTTSTTTTTTSTSTTGVARQVVASATSATAKRLSFFRTRSPSNATDKTNSTANNNPLPPSSLSSSTTPSNSSNSSGNTTTTTTTTSNGTSYHPMSEMPPSPNITSPMALAMATANAAAIIASPHIYQHHQHQHHRSHSAAASVVANHEATTAATVTTGTRRRFLFGRSTPSNTTTTTTTSSSNTSNGTVQETMTVDTQHTSHSTTTTTSTDNNLVTTKNISSNTSLPSLVSAQ